MRHATRPLVQSLVQESLNESPATHSFKHPKGMFDETSENAGAGSDE